jgi:hypothetical protein
VRFNSAEPLLGPLGELDLTGIHWVIVGGESGPDFRPMDVEWARTIRDQCLEAGVAFFFKQWGGVRPTSGAHLLDDRAWSEYPRHPQDQPRDGEWRIETEVGQEQLSMDHDTPGTAAPQTVDRDDPTMSENTSAAKDMIFDEPRGSLSDHCGIVALDFQQDPEGHVPLVLRLQHRSQMRS